MNGRKGLRGRSESPSEFPLSTRFLPSCSFHSMETSAREARFEVTEEFARDAFHGLEDLKDEVEPALKDVREQLQQLHAKLDGALLLTAAEAAAATGGSGDGEAEKLTGAACAGALVVATAVAVPVAVLASAGSRGSATGGAAVAATDGAVGAAGGAAASSASTAMRTLSGIGGARVGQAIPEDMVGGTIWALGGRWGGPCLSGPLLHIPHTLSGYSA